MVQDFSGGWRVSALPASPPPAYLLHRAGKYNLVLLVAALKHGVSLSLECDIPSKKISSCSQEDTSAALSFFLFFSFFGGVTFWHSVSTFAFKAE